MAGKIYATDGKIITDGFPQLQIGDKLYRIDTRKSTYDGMQAEINRVPNPGEDKASDEDTIVRFTMGAEALAEIKEMDLSISGYMNLIIYIQAAIFDISFEEAQDRFQKAR